MTFFNDNDAYACAWLRNLYPEAVIDGRSITDIEPDDLMGHERVHLFAGIGGWEYALDLAEWPAEREIWSASLPCQPFSAAGKRAGVDDARHLWPEMFRLVRACSPECLIGEQVGSTLGREWLARVFDDLASCGYRTGAVDLPACSAGAPHIRQRLYWVAHTSAPGRGALQRARRTNGRAQVEPDGHGDADRLEHAPRDGRQQRRAEPSERGTEPQREPGGLADAERHDGRPDEPGRRPQGRGADGRPGSGDGGLADADGSGQRPDIGHDDARQPDTGRGGPLNFWSDAILIPCADGRARRALASIQPLAYGLPAALDGAGPISRVGALRGAGNAITPQVAALFIRAFLDCEREEFLTC